MGGSGQSHWHKGAQSPDVHRGMSHMPAGGRTGVWGVSSVQKKNDTKTHKKCLVEERYKTNSIHPAKMQRSPQNLFWIVHTRVEGFFFACLLPVFSENHSERRTVSHNHHKRPKAKRFSRWKRSAVSEAVLSATLGRTVKGAGHRSHLEGRLEGGGALTPRWSARATAA